MKTNTALSLKNISKFYPGVIALDNVSIDLNCGEIHAIVGENGAGKSTLIKAISGAIQPEKGDIIVFGDKITAMDPVISQSYGISVIYQDFNLAPEMTIAENIFLGKEPRKGPLLDRKTMNQKTSELLKSLNIDLDPDTQVKTLSAAFKQMLEVAKALSNDLKVLIMDEPTAALANAEVVALFKLVKELKTKNIAVVFISHRLDEVFEIADVITVLRDGKTVSTVKAEDINRGGLINLMVGRELAEQYPHRDSRIGDVVFELKNICGNGDKDINLSVRKGEILGLGGLVGAGRSELAMMLMGMERKQSGSIIMNGREIEIKSPSDAIKYGIGLVAEDRKRFSLLTCLSVRWNVTLATIAKFSTAGVIRKKEETKVVQHFEKLVNIKTPNLDQIVSNLSGGNQQKVAVSKWLATDLKVMIFDEPTQGVDVGARYEIYKIINDLCDQGMAVIMISSDMEELLGMSDRIIVLAEGKQTGEIQKTDFSQQLVLQYASNFK